MRCPTCGQPLPVADADLPIELMAVGVRAYNRLVAAGVKTLADLRAMSDHDLLALPGFGAGSLADVHEALSDKRLREARELRQMGLPTQPMHATLGRAG